MNLKSSGLKNYQFHSIASLPFVFASFLGLFMVGCGKAETSTLPRSTQVNQQINPQSGVATPDRLAIEAAPLEPIPTGNADDQDGVQPLPLSQGMSYREARKRVIKAGWKPNLQGDPPNLRDPVVRGLFEGGYEEIKDCSGTGEGPCLLEFVNSQGQVLAITTVSGGRQRGERIVRGWHVEEPKVNGNPTSPGKIIQGRYWLGNTDQALEVQQSRYRYVTELGSDPWQPIAGLRSVKYGVVVDDKQTYWCLASLAPKDRAIACSAEGWVTGTSQDQSLPFVGTRRFNFLGGSGTGQSITIASDGQTTVQRYGTTRSSIEYSGKFANPIVLESGQRLLIQGNKVYSVQADGKVAPLCNSKEPDHAPCEATLY